MAGVPLPGLTQTAAGADPAVKWSKAPCRFCGTGCSVLVGVQNGRIVATQGDPDSPVNRGLNCIKGYFLSKIMYGADRVKTPMLRMKDGKYDKNGEFAPITWKQAFDIMEEKAKETMKAKGPNGLAMFGSGQWTVWEGYAAAKLMKAGFRTNNIDPNARHCMASAVAGFMRTFGIDEPMGCYDDIEHADAFVLWGSNMAEMHPILWSRITDRRLGAKHVKIFVLSTYGHRSSELADVEILFKPQTDLAIMNYICNHIIQSGAVNQDFVTKHVAFRKGVTDIGYGLRPNHPLEQVANNNGYAGADGKPLPLETVADVVDARSKIQIYRVDKQRAVKILGDIKPGAAMSTVGGDIAARIASARLLPPGYRIASSGMSEMLGDSLADFGEAILLAAFLTLLVLVFSFVGDGLRDALDPQSATYTSEP